MSALQCDVSTPFNLCGVNTFFQPQTEFGACQERLLLIGQMTEAGTAQPNRPMQVFGNEDELFGSDSMAAAMVRAARCQAAFADLWVLPLADFGTPGSADVTFSDSANLAIGEVITLVVNGEAYSVSVTPGDTEADIVTAFVAAISDPYLTVTGAGDTLTIETSNGGAKGGQLSVLTDYAALGISASTQVTTDVNVTAGGGVPVLDPALAALGDDQYTFIANPYCDLVSLSKMQDHTCKMWAPRMRVRPEVYTVTGGEVADAQALAGSLSAPQIHLGYQAGAVTPAYEATAAFATAAYSLMNKCNDPLSLSNPICGEVLTCLSAPVSRLLITEVDALTGDGVSVLGQNANGEVEISTFNTTYTQNNQGIQDDAFADGQNVARLRCIASIVEDRIQGVYGRHTIRSDGYAPRAGQRVATTWQIREFVRGLGVQLSDLNLIEDPQGWANAVDVQWDGGNSCVNICVEPNLVNKLCCINLFVKSSI